MLGPVVDVTGSDAFAKKKRLRLGIPPQEPLLSLSGEYLEAIRRARQRRLGR